MAVSTTLEDLLSEHESYKEDFDEELWEEFCRNHYEQFLVRLSWSDLAYRYATKELIEKEPILEPNPYIEAFSLSAKELEGRPEDIPEDYTLSALLSRSLNLPENNIQDVYTRIWEGGMPDMISMDAELRREYWNSYIDSYLMRDAVDDNGIQDTEGFRRLLRACAAFAGELINYNDLGSAAGVSGATAKEWVKILQTMGIVFLLEPCFNNELKRMIKTPTPGEGMLLRSAA